ncbi:MAG: 4a-hydroxytetrahydrobiopterin dehydratase [Nitrospirae bacterium]|nr:4a-hydroxytetrahydrobiopterin dehydratase [Nitrospirota bacterium]
MELKKEDPAQDEPVALSEGRAGELARGIPEWSLKEGALEKEFRFKDFLQAIDFVNKVAALAEKQDHHPDIVISYNKVKLTLSTHAVGGLSKKDFVLATAIDAIGGKPD